MALLKCTDTYWRFAGQCTQCGHCTKSCASLTKADMTLGEIAKEMLAMQRDANNIDEVKNRILNNPKLIQAVRGCFFCTQCKNTCFAHNDVCDLIYHTRIDFQEMGLIPREAWSSVLVDQEWDIFKAYRAVHGIYFTDLTRHVATQDHPAENNCQLAFFPGCSMAAYGPELTREIFQTLSELGGKTTMIDHCCGSPLKSAGFYDRAEKLLNLITEEIKNSGAKELITICPGCANAMREVINKSGLDIVVTSLAAYLKKHGFKAKKPLPNTALCVSKSCQDRTGEYQEETLALLELDPNTTQILYGCCGAGGAVSAYEPDRQAQQVDIKLSHAPEGSTVITMCPTCTYTYAFRQMSAPKPITNKHYTELIFQNELDWNKVFAQLNSMWTGEYGPWLAQVFA